MHDCSYSTGMYYSYSTCMYIAIVNACTIAIVHACTIAIVMLGRSARVLGGWSRGRRALEGEGDDGDGREVAAAESI